MKTIRKWIERAEKQAKDDELRHRAYISALVNRNKGIPEWRRAQTIEDAMHMWRRRAGAL
jgi:hypothetical protein